jgi:carboxylate-amine ligase
MFKQFTLGIEEEFQIVDPHTRELRSHVSEILEEGKMLLGEQVKPEMIQSMIEVGTGICKDIKEARSDITNLRGILSGLVRKKDWRLSLPVLIRSRIGRIRRFSKMPDMN